MIDGRLEGPFFPFNNRAGPGNEQPEGMTYICGVSVGVL